MLDRIRIVLVRPQSPGNVGGVCRAMANMGLSDLRIVAPECDLAAPEARWRAARAETTLDSATVVASIGEALGGCVVSYATSAKGGFHRRQIAVTPRVAAAGALDAAGPVAMVFGPEDRGLVQEELLHFDRLIEIPANPAYGALNLAAAVQVVAYELYLESLVRAGLPPLPPMEDAAPDERKRVMFEKLFAALDRIGFFAYQQDPNHLRYAIRRVLGRCVMSANEVDVFIGVAQQIQSFANRSERRGD